MPSVVEPARHSVLLGTTAKAGAGRPAEAPGRAAWPRPGTPATLPVSVAFSASWEGHSTASRTPPRGSGTRSLARKDAFHTRLIITYSPFSSSQKKIRHRFQPPG